MCLAVARWLCGVEMLGRLRGVLEGTQHAIRPDTQSEAKEENWTALMMK